MNGLGQDDSDSSTPVQAGFSFGALGWVAIGIGLLFFVGAARRMK